MSAPDSPLAQAACDNCGAALAGPFCAQCGQSHHNPMRHFAHAVEEVFESFWHLDGRVFRTLRDLLVPGKVAAGYIAGHRVRYVAPLRLFLVLSVLAFFVAQSAVHLAPGAIRLDPDGGASAAPSFATARTVEEVERLRDAQLSRMRADRVQVAGVPVARMAIDTAIKTIENGADARIRAIRGGIAPAPAPLVVADEDDELIDPTKGTADNPIGLMNGKRPWHETQNAYVIDGWPRLSRWWNARVGVAARNLPRIKDNPDLLKTAIVRSIPAALLVMLPLFAVLLKLLYWRQRRGYLEHVVVGLYSHAFACVVLLAVCVVTLAQNALGAGWMPATLGLLKAALWAWLPVYLLLMQKRVYGQDWWRTAAKFAVLGTLYALLLTLAIVPVLLVAFIRA